MKKNPYYCVLSRRERSSNYLHYIMFFNFSLCVRIVTLIIHTFKCLSCVFLLTFYIILYVHFWRPSHTRDVTNNWPKNAKYSPAKCVAPKLFAPTGTCAPMWEFAAKVHYHIEMIDTADRAGFQTIPRVSALTLQLWPARWHAEKGRFHWDDLSCLSRGSGSVQSVQMCL